MTPNEYWNLITRPMVDRFNLEPTAYDLAFASCLFEYHFCEILAESCGLNKEVVAEEIKAKDCNFGIVQGVGILAKHYRVSDPNVVELHETEIHNTSIGGAAAFSDGTFWSDGTSWSDSPNVVRIQTSKGRLLDVVHVVSSVAGTIERYFLV